jgi:urease subunit alpha
MGRVGETVRRTFQLADKMRGERGGEHPRHDNERVLRYLAKCTINPAIAHGLSHDVGSITPGRVADIVLWQPALFAVKPELVLKSGFPAWGVVGDPNAATMLCEPLIVGPQYGAFGAAAAELSIVFCAQAAVDAGTRLGTRKRVSAVHATRGIGPAEMIRNTRMGAVRVDPATLVVTLDGEPVSSPPASRVSLSRLYLLG